MESNSVENENANNALIVNQSDQIDLYADVEASEFHNNTKSNNLDETNLTNFSNKPQNEESLQNDDGVVVSATIDEPGLYDDVMAAPTPSNISANEQEYNMEHLLNGNDENENEFHESDLMKSSDSQNNNSQNSNSNSNNQMNSGSSYSYPNSSNNQYGQRKYSCYIGGLNWWTTDKDVSDALVLVGINDLLDVKFYENKINGQSKGFASVVVGSDASFRSIMDKMPKQQINGQDPIVTPFNRFYYNQFEEQARKDMPSMNGNNGSQDSTYNNDNYNNGMNKPMMMNHQGSGGMMGSNLQAQNQFNMSMFLHFLFIY
jgi:hypothetical protein